MLKKVLVTSFILLLSSANLFAWGERKGLMLGLGLGVGYDSYSNIDYDLISSDKLEDSTIAFAASPRLGYAFDNQNALLYARHPFSFKAEDDNGNKQSMTSCIEGIGFYHYFNETAPSLYVAGGAGVAYFFRDDKGNYASDTPRGVGLLGIVGFEFMKFLSVEFGTFYKRPQADASDIGFAFTVNALGY